MFPASEYAKRRQSVKEQMGSGLLVFLGNDESPRNYPDNPYTFRQDSSFLYFFALDSPGLGAVIDVDADSDIVFGDDLTVEQIVWMGPQASLGDRCQAVGVQQVARRSDLREVLTGALGQGRTVHFLPPYRASQVAQLSELLEIPRQAVGDSVSESLIKAVVAQRSMKTKEEVEQIEMALDVACEMQTAAIRMTRPGIVEREVAGAIEGIALSRGCRLAFPTIFSIRGETLHNPFHGNVMQDGDLAVHDSGAESPLYYASDITRTIPVGGRFSQRQREIYSIVLDAQEAALAAVTPGVEFRAIHRLACLRLVAGLKDLNMIRGSVDEAVEAGAHALFFPCGVGHMLGLDVHDMEALGEDYVGYTDTIRRNPEFGWCSLRLAKALEPGFVVTVEPGVYFIPELIDQWRAEQKCVAHINYDIVETFEGFGGVRIEDDVLVTDEGHRVLGPKIPKTIDEIEEATLSG